MADDQIASKEGDMLSNEQGEVNTTPQVSSFLWQISKTIAVD